MKAKLIFTLPDEDMEFNRCSKALDLALAIWDIDQYLRDLDKYDKEYTITGIRDKFVSILNEHDINLDTLIE